MNSPRTVVFFLCRSTPDLYFLLHQPNLSSFPLVFIASSLCFDVPHQYHSPLPTTQNQTALLAQITGWRLRRKETSHKTVIFPLLLGKLSSCLYTLWW